jgi:uroporphyrinogen-III synthase
MIDPGAAPLEGKRVVVTRAVDQAGELIRALEHLDAEVILVPAVAFDFPEDSVPLDRALRELARFGWVLFTSQNAVRFVAVRLKQLGLPPSVRCVAAVGPATAEAARQQGFHVDYTASQHTAHALAFELRDQIATHRVLLPRSDRSDPHLTNALREIGARVDDPIAYRTAAPATPPAAVLEPIRRAEFDVAVFASPSAFQNFDAFLGTGVLAKLAERVRIAAIGPTTTKVMRAAGVRVHIEAEEASASGLADAIAKYFHEHRAPLRHS